VKYVFYCLLPSLIGCAALTAPTDPADPTSPTPLDGLVETGGAALSAGIPVWGAIIAAGGGAAYLKWKKQQAAKAAATPAP